MKIFVRILCDTKIIKKTAEFFFTVFSKNKNYFKSPIQSLLVQKRPPGNQRLWPLLPFSLLIPFNLLPRPLKK